MNLEKLCSFAKRQLSAKMTFIILKNRTRQGRLRFQPKCYGKENQKKSESLWRDIKFDYDDMNIPKIEKTCLIKNAQYLKSDTFFALELFSV